MKNFLLSLSLLMSAGVFAQAKIDPTKLNYAPIDASVMDAVYYPLQVLSERGGQPKIKVVYSRPQKKNRVVFGNLLKYGEIWRFGANENTEIRFYTPVRIGGKDIAAGTYSLFAIPTEKEWTIILNTEIDRWGAFSYDKSKDVLRLNVPVERPAGAIENFSISFVKTSTGTDMYAGWDSVQVRIPIEIK